MPESAADKNFLLELNVEKTYERHGDVWTPEEPDLEGLEGSWVKLEFSPLLFINPIFGLVGESSDTLRMETAIDIMNLTCETFVDYNIDAVYKLSILEPPAVTSANSVIKDVEEESLEKSRVYGISRNAHAIKKLKDHMPYYRAAELINYLGADIDFQEETTDESDIIGEEFAEPGKNKNDFDDFMKAESVQKWAKSMQEKEDEIEEKSIEQILAEMKGMNEDESDKEIMLYADWIDLLGEMRDPMIDGIIRNLYFDIKSLK